MLQATHMEPGEVVMHASPVGGILDAGRYPAGIGPLVEQVAGDLRSAGFDARPDGAVILLKYAKLIENLANAVQALCGLEANAGELVRKVRGEGVAVLRAAGIGFSSESEMDERRAEVMRGLRPIEGQARGGSTWQSLARGAGSIETDFLNGEIALLGALHGVPAPYNRVLQRVSAEAIRDGRKPGSFSAEELMALAEREPGDEEGSLQSTGSDGSSVRP
jgi:2-dehydropantoate 2-reductase